MSLFQKQWLILFCNWHNCWYWLWHKPAFSVHEKIFLIWYVVNEMTHTQVCSDFLFLNPFTATLLRLSYQEKKILFELIEKHTKANTQKCNKTTFMLVWWRVDRLRSPLSVIGQRDVHDYYIGDCRVTKARGFFSALGHVSVLCWLLL